MSKQLEAELRAAKTEADAAVDVCMSMLDEIAKAAVGARIEPRAGAIIGPGSQVQPELAVIQVPIPYELMKHIATALNLWRASRETGTVQ